MFGIRVALDVRGCFRLDCGAGVWIRVSVGNYRFAPDHTITAPQAIFCIQERLQVIQHDVRSLTEEDPP